MERNSLQIFTVFMNSSVTWSDRLFIGQKQGNEKKCWNLVELFLILVVAGGRLVKYRVLKHLCVCVCMYVCVSE